MHSNAKQNKFLFDKYIMYYVLQSHLYIFLTRNINKTKTLNLKFTTPLYRV